MQWTIIDIPSIHKDIDEEYELGYLYDYNVIAVSDEGELGEFSFFEKDNHKWSVGDTFKF